MKFNFKKIASVLTGAVMLSSTVALAAAANFPAPFVKSGAGDYAVVYGAATTTTDGVAAADINSWLAGKVTTTVTPVTPTNTTLTDGDTVQIQKTNDKFNYGDALNGFATLDGDDDSLPVVLGTTYYYDDGNDEYEYEQEITLGDQTLGWNQNNEFNDKKPWMGFDFSSGNIMTYSLNFNDKVPEDWVTDANSIMKSTVIKIMGRDFFISDTGISGGNPTMTLLDTANSVRINEGETQTLKVGDKEYDVTVISVNDGGADDDTVNLEVDGVEITSELSVGETAKLRGEDVYVGVKAATYKSKEGSVSTAVITMGSGQLVLEDGEEVKLNGDPLSELDAYDPYVLTAGIVNDSSGDLQKITLTWSVDDDVFIAPGTSLTFPALETVKLSMGNWVTPTPEIMTFEDSSDALRMNAEVEEGTLDMSVFYSDDGTVVSGLGDTSNDRLVTSTSDFVTLNGTSNDYFVATWISDDEAETYAFKFDSISSTNETKFLSLVDGGADVTLDGVGLDNAETVGDNLEFALLDANKAQDWVKLNVSSTTGEVYLDRLVTKDGLQMRLPVAGQAGDINEYNASVSTTVALNFTEEDAETENVGEGKSFVVTFGPSEDGTEPKSVSGAVVSHPIESRSDISGIYVTSDLASYLEFDDVDSGAATLEVQYHPTESYAEVYVSESKVAFGEGSGNGGSAGTVLVTDSQVSSVQGKNLVVVGGSCVNTVAAKLLGSETPLCEAAWMTATNNVGAGSFLIQTFNNPWTAGKVATLVAGYDATDTDNAVKALKVETSIDTTVGKKYVKLAGSTLQLV